MLSNTTADTAVLKVEAVDKDLLLNGTVSYTIKKTDGSHYNLFTIDQSGTIRTRKSLKNGKLNCLLYFPFDGRSTSITCPVGLENKVLRLEVEASDQGVPPLQSTIPVELHVVSGQHTLPQFSQQVYYISIYEDSPVNTTAAQVKMISVEPTTFTIVPPGNHTASFPFSINADGRIMVSDVLDADMYSEYNFVVAAALKEAPDYIGHANIKIKIIDDNDNAPLFVGQQFMVRTPESYSGERLRLLPLQAFDADSGANAEVRYELLQDMLDGPFAVQERSGWLTVGRQLDREGQAEYSLRVRAYDLGTPSLSSTATVNVQVCTVEG